MPTRSGFYYLSIAILCACAAVSVGATLRDGGDPPKDTIIWGDNFDNYSQWCWDNRSDPQWTRGTLWQGGPIPAGDPSGGWPRKSADNTGCPVSPQLSPAPYEYMRTLWTEVMQCGTITSPTGGLYDSGAVEAKYHEGTCGTGQVYTTSSGIQVSNYTNFMGGSHSSMDQFKYRLADRITAVTNYRISQGQLPAGTINNAVNGTDEKPLILWFQLIDGSGAASHALNDNWFVELGLGDDHAPTDYIWRGNPTEPNQQCALGYCPQGPYPVICQQVRETNGSGSEDATDLSYLNANCPPLVAPYDAQTGLGKTWHSIAFGLMSIMDKDPCGCEEQGVDSHVPQVDHFAVFDGNVWRQLRSNRYTGLANMPLPAPPYNSATMTPGGGSSGFSYSSTANSANIYLIVLKITTDSIMIWVKAPDTSQHGATISRVYKGPFDTISVGMSPGCELSPVLDPASQTYVCKSGGTPKQCLTYGGTTFDNGYNRVTIDSLLLYEGALTQSTNMGACCRPDGICEDGKTLAECQALNGRYEGDDTTCATTLCCPLPYADADTDGDVDQDDFGAFQMCYNGAGAVPTGCECYDRNTDGKVDVTDFTSFGNCWTGPNVPWSTSITPNCMP